MAALYKNIHPVKYYRDYLSQDIRPDGRGLLEFRPVTINVGTIGTAEGSAIVKIGNTTVVCGIKAELFTPKAEEPDRGQIVANVELPALCSSQLKPGPPSDDAQVCSGFMDRLLTSSQVVDTRQLCICPDKLAWVLYCDFVCLNHDGAVIDACVLTLVAALKTVTLPEVEYNPETQAISVNDSVRKPLQVDTFPVATTFAIFDSHQILADPNDEEERFGTGVITIMVQDGKMSSIHKPGGSPVTQAQLETCFSKAKEHADHLQKMVKTAFNASPER
ncbi:exosome complex component RRP43-like [Macrosteles quadrilineatus]|uniref:exosome complex component RRP43-like n=1 Tax=Macrosteles quadrilineatus TaxID=74068 RepID=UPI0023E0FB1B|nr:exosome complex component RRP43-like [Macrosteles quadrilineatus]